MSPEEIQSITDIVRAETEYKHFIITAEEMRSVLKALQTLQVQLEDARRDAMDARADAADDVWNAAIRLVRR